jgi:rubrerythrin
LSRPERSGRALKTAIEAEKKSLRNYLDFALKTDDPSGKNMFIRLASDEAEHVSILECQARHLQEHGDWLKLEIEPSEVEMIVPRLERRDIKVRGTSGHNQLAALEIALALELKAMEYYRHQHRLETDAKARDMYQRLAKMEEAHYELIQAELDSITNTGFWFGLREFSLEIE